MQGIAKSKIKDVCIIFVINCAAICSLYRNSMNCVREEATEDTDKCLEAIL